MLILMLVVSFMRSVSMHRKFIDFTDSSYAGGNIEMLKETISYDRCAQIVTNAFLNGLVKSGLPIDQAFNVFTSKAFRHKLDWDLEDNLEKVACKAGEHVGGEYKKMYKKDRKYLSWMNDGLNVLIQQELERRLQEHEEDKKRKV